MILRLGALLACATLAAAACAADTAPSRTAVAHGKGDIAIPGWTIATIAPTGWTIDCCTYASAIGVNMVLYRGDWSGDPQRVMVLNVWPRNLPTLDAEWRADRQRYLQRDSHGTVAAFALDRNALPCHGVQYQGSDRIDDIVVFCDPGKGGGVRLSWSMSLAHGDPHQAQLVAWLRQVVAHTSYTMALPPRTTPAHH